MDLEKKLLEPSSHPFAGKQVYFATMHGKTDILKPLFAEIGMVCVPAPVDTDSLGTFSGEIERTGSVRETLKEKIRICAEKYPDAEFIVASEGTFGLHPILGFFQTGLESLLFWHRSNKTELYAEFLDLNPLVAEDFFTSQQGAEDFFNKVNFPVNGLIIHPENLLEPIFKGLHKSEQVYEAMAACAAIAPEKKIVLKTDLRACHNERRRMAIYEAGKLLLKALNSYCPSCSLPGFVIDEIVPGLECEQCGAPTRLAEKEVLKCKACGLVEERLRSDGKVFADPGCCDFCNP
jgi:ribosomal protein S27AE